MSEEFRKLEVGDIIDISPLQEESKKRRKNQFQGWISVKDRLPLYKQVILVYLDNKIITEAVYRGEYCKGEHMFRIQLTYDDTHERITHWMPLPEPPK